jgi:hypothetical protein
MVEFALNNSHSIPYTIYGIPLNSIKLSIIFQFNYNVYVNFKYIDTKCPLVYQTCVFIHVHVVEMMVLFLFSHHITVNHILEFMYYPYYITLPFRCHYE